MEINSLLTPEEASRFLDEPNGSAATTEDVQQSKSVVKLALIDEASKRKEHEALVSLATSAGGFLVDGARQQAWPVLLGVEDDVQSRNNDDPKWTDLPEHRSEHQVQLDVDRSFIFYPYNLSTQSLESRKIELSHLINEVLRRYPILHYFQGFHDICQVFLLVLGLERAVPCVTRLCLTRIRDFMLPSLSPALSHLMLLPDIVRAEDSSLWRHISHTQPFFALSATLTLYAHDVQAYDDIARLFDVILAREPVFSLYMFARIVLNRREELLDIPPDEPEMIHFVLNKVPQSLDLDSLVSEAVDLWTKYPPEGLQSWGKISKHSVLKTARDSKETAKQTLDDGASIFHKQAAELHFMELRQEAFKSLRRYQRPALSIGLAVIVCVLAWRMRNHVW